MKRATIFISLAFSFVLFFSSTKAQTLTVSKQFSIEKEIDSLFMSSVKSAESLNYEALHQGVDDRHEAGFIANSTYYASFDSLLNFVRSRSQGISKQTISLTGKKITVLSETIALVTAYGEATVEITSGESFTRKFFWTFVYQKINNNWRVIQSHQSL